MDRGRRPMARARREAAVRRQLVDGMPVVQTSMRVPGGDAVQRVYAAPAPDTGEVAVVEITNESPAPFVVALVVRGAAAVDLGETTVYADGLSALRTARPPSRWAMSADASTEDIVTSGGASDAPFAARHDRGARLVAAFLYPVAHRTSLRAAVALGTRGLGAVEVQALPAADAVARGLAGPARPGTAGRAARPHAAGGGRRRSPRCGAGRPGVESRSRGGRGARGLGPRRRGGRRVGPADGRERRRIARREPATGLVGAGVRAAAAPRPRCAPRRSTRGGGERRRRHPRAPRRLAARVGRAPGRRARRTHSPRLGVVLGAVARRPSRVAVGRARRRAGDGARARPGVVVDRTAR